MYYNNNMQKRQELNQRKADAGFVSEKFPEVTSMVIQMTYYQKMMYADTETVLMVRTVNVSPENHAYFYMNCMIKECNGGFDMAPVIRKMVKARKKKVEGKLSCNGKGDGLASNHASIQYEIKANYKRKRSR